MHVYLDNNATTSVRPEVLEAMTPFFGEHYGNPSSIHWYGQHAKAALDQARGEVADLIGAQPGEIVFTSGGTESDNLAIRGVAALGRGHIITSSVEHHAVLNTCRDLAKDGFEVTEIGVDANGLVDVDAIRRSIRPDTILISVMHANNEIGTIQPIEQIGQLAEEAGVRFHSDGVQAAGKIPVDVGRLKAHFYSLSSHKIHGPKGVGALFVRKGTSLRPMATGGGHERNRRAGTENVPGIAGFGRAARLARENLAVEMVRLGELRDSMEARLKAAIGDIHVNAESAPRLPNTSNIMVDYAEGEGLVIALDLKGIAASTGSACSSGSMEPSHVLTAIGKTPDEGFGSLRISLGALTSAGDVDRLVETLPGIVARLRQLSPHYNKR